jgi:hypothetical protein
MKKKGQEEIVGFVLIVVLVAIVGVILLGIALRRPPSEVQQESRDIYRFLESMMDYTSECSVSYEPDYAKVRELLVECYSNPTSSCTSGEKACESLEITIKGILDVSWQTGPDRPIKGYMFNSSYTSDIKEENVISVSAGECALTFSGSEYISPAFPGTIVSSLRLCY